MPHKDPEARRAYEREAYRRNREAILEQRKRHNVDRELAIAREKRKRSAERTETGREKRRNYYQRTAESRRGYARRWQKINRGKCNDSARRWYEKNRERILQERRIDYHENKERLASARKRWSRNKRIRDYGLEPEQFERMVADQAGRCAICGTEQPGGKGFHIDHCHSTGAVRGLLCVRCNTGLGSFKDDESLMAKAIDYLKRSKEWPSAAQTA